MNRVRIVLAAILFATGVAKAGDQPPIKLYAQPAAALAARLSPDGKRVALIATYQGRQVLYVHSLEEGGKDGKIVRTADFEIRWVRWKDNDHLIAGVVKATDRLFGDINLSNFSISRLASVDADGSHVAMIGEPPGGFPRKDEGGTRSLDLQAMIHPQIQDDVLSVLPQTPGRIIQEVVDRFPLAGTRFGPALYSVDIATGRHELLDRGDERMAHYLLGQDNVARVGIEYDKGDKVVYGRADLNDGWHEISRTSVNGGEIFLPLALLPDNPRLIYALSNKGPDGKQGLWSVDALTGRFVDLIDGDATIGGA